MPKKNLIGGRDRWEVENDLRSLREASKINKDSKRVKSVKLLVKEELGALKDLAGTKEGF